MLQVGFSWKQVVRQRFTSSMIIGECLWDPPWKRGLGSRSGQRRKLSCGQMWLTHEKCRSHYGPSELCEVVWAKIARLLSLIYQSWKALSWEGVWLWGRQLSAAESVYHQQKESLGGRTKYQPHHCVAVGRLFKLLNSWEHQCPFSKMRVIISIRVVVRMYLILFHQWI